MNLTRFLFGAAFTLPTALMAQQSQPAKPTPPLYTFSSHHGRIGVAVATRADADSDRIGARITAVFADGPAAKIGIRAGDVVIQFAGVVLANTRAENTEDSGPGMKLRKMAQALSPGDTVTVEYRRGSTVIAGLLVARDVFYSFNGTLGGKGGSTPAASSAPSARGADAQESPALDSTYWRQLQLNLQGI